MATHFLVQLYYIYIKTIAGQLRKSTLTILKRSHYGYIIPCLQFMDNNFVLLWAAESSQTCKSKQQKQSYESSPLRKCRIQGITQRSGLPGGDEEAGDRDGLFFSKYSWIPFKLYFLCTYLTFVFIKSHGISTLQLLRLVQSIQEVKKGKQRNQMNINERWKPMYEIKVELIA